MFVVNQYSRNLRVILKLLSITNNLREVDMATVLARDEAGNIASIENGNLIIFNHSDGSIKLEVPFKKAGDIIDILRAAKERVALTQSRTFPLLER